MLARRQEAPPGSTQKGLSGVQQGERKGEGEINGGKFRRSWHKYTGPKEEAVGGDRAQAGQAGSKTSRSAGFSLES